MLEKQFCQLELDLDDCAAVVLGKLVPLVLAEELATLAVEVLHGGEVLARQLQRAEGAPTRRQHLRLDVGASHLQALFPLALQPVDDLLVRQVGHLD